LFAIGILAKMKIINEKKLGVFTTHFNLDPSKIPQNGTRFLTSKICSHPSMSRLLCFTLGASQISSSEITIIGDFYIAG